VTIGTLLENFQQISTNQQFIFSCHPGIPCFTECCRELDLALTPYDVLRLKRHLNLSSSKFIEQYVIIEWEEEQLFPTCYLTMIDDGKASCVFVRETGCSVYADRPGSCRAYPLGRGASRNNGKASTESLILIQEPHCRGFEATNDQTVSRYLLDQGMELYNQFNDILLPLLQHKRIQQQEFRPSRQHLDQYILALYDLDQFRRQMSDGRIALQRPLTPQHLKGLAGDDEELVLLGLCWLMQEFFGE
jgi:Fe-S-cluster containining protein